MKLLHIFFILNASYDLLGTEYSLLYKAHFCAIWKWGNIIQKESNIILYFQWQNMWPNVYIFCCRFFLIITYTSDNSLYIWSTGCFKSIFYCKSLHITFFQILYIKRIKHPSYVHEVQSQWANQSCKIFVLNDIVCIDRHVECLKVMQKKYDLCLLPWTGTGTQMCIDSYHV